MISDSTVGWEIARWVRANAKELGVMRGHLSAADLDRAAEFGRLAFDV